MMRSTPCLWASLALASCAGLSGPPAVPTPPFAAAAELDTPPPAPRADAGLALDGAVAARRQERAAPTDEDLVAANNPLANFTAFNLHDYYVPEISGTDRTANTMWLRYAQPLEMFGGSWLLRASLPLQRLPDGPIDSDAGLGDANVFATYLLDSDDPARSVGVGPILGLPTASDDGLGTDQWSAGAAAILFDASSPLLQYGGLLTYQHKIGGSSRAPDVNLLVAQPFGILQLGDGLYLRSTGIWAFDLETGSYNVPFGLGVGKVIALGGVVLNVFLEPQATVLSEGPGQPEFQVFFGMNTLFVGG